MKKYVVCVFCYCLLLNFTSAMELITVNTTGDQGNGESNSASISANGRYIMFASDADNLVSNDTNGYRDIFVYDRDTQEISRVSVDSHGNQANGASGSPLISLLSNTISADGRYVVFQSDANNLVTNDTNNDTDVFLHDRQMGTTRIVSVDSHGNQADAFTSFPSISADGRYISFESNASNLVAGVITTNHQVYIHDQQTGVTSLASVDNLGNPGNYASGNSFISANGRYVTFMSYADNLVANDTNNAFDIFVHDIANATTSRVSIDSQGNEADRESGYPSISADGRYVTFTSYATNLTSDISSIYENAFIHDRQTGETKMISIDNIENQFHYDAASYPLMSADGRYVTFLGADLTRNIIDLMIYDRYTGETALVSKNYANNTQPDNHSITQAISGDNQTIVFASLASDLVAGDLNNTWDIFTTDNPLKPAALEPNIETIPVMNTGLLFLMMSICGLMMAISKKRSFNKNTF